ncbi:MAG: phenylacetic acid degradation bifunctional protein PaaZ [Pseudomonadota bacterium]
MVLAAERGPKVRPVESFVLGAWSGPGASARPIAGAVTGDPVARCGHDGLDFQAMVHHGRQVGGPALRALNFHERARTLKALAGYLTERKEQLYALSTMTGATRKDSWIDIDGGIGTLFAFASKGRRELPESHTVLDGDLEMLSRNGTFVGQHVYTPKKGVAVHINAFNFPVWGMLEKLAPAFLGGLPVITKPATATSYVAEACFRLIVESGLLPEGAVQFVAGGTGDLFHHLGAQDSVSFTGSADTALMLRSHGHLLKHSIPFIAEQDSLNATVLGHDVTPGTPEYDIFLSEVVAEMTTKAGQKCTAIRRILVPEAQLDAVAARLEQDLAAVSIGDPALKETRMGALVSLGQRLDVQQKIAALKAEGRMVFGEAPPNVQGADGERGAFVSPTLLLCDDPDAASAVHRVEAFGPVATVMPYRNVDHAAALLNRGDGSLVASVITHDPALARQFVEASASHHGRLYFNDRDSMAEATGHGSPLPNMVHGGPGRAGGGEELGGIRAVLHNMQRTAVQGSPRLVAAAGQTWVPGAPVQETESHPFTRTFDHLQLGEVLKSDSRTITLEDIEHFAHFTGDTFYAHMDDDAAKANPFFPGRVAHGYLLLSFAAGLFVQPDPGPVLANTGLADLAFQKPVEAGDSIRVELTVKRKTRRTDTYGEVRWHVALFNQDDEPVATYMLFTMNAYDECV